jgi:4a-hydroxytetrahydrobiopterin dehydratase
MTNKLSSAEIDAFLSSSQSGPCHWSIQNGKICISLRFPTFREAFSFMTSVALYAESHDHHPEWSNVYNLIEIALSTHDMGGITQKDIDLAAFITKIYPCYVDSGLNNR